MQLVREPNPEPEQDPWMLLEDGNISSDTILSRVLRDSTFRFVDPWVRPSVCWSVTIYFFGVFWVFGLAAPAQMLH